MHPPSLRPGSSSESDDGQLAHLWPDVRRDRRHHHRNYGQGAAQQGEEALRAGARDQNL